MKTRFLLLAVLLFGSALFLSGCMSGGVYGSNVSTPEGSAYQHGFYLDLVGRGRQVYPTPHLAPPPVVYGQPVSYSGMPAYDSYGLYSSSYARYYVEASVPVRHDYRYGHGPTTVVYDYDRGHVPPPHGRYHQPPVQVVVERPPRTYVQPPYIIPPSGSTTVVTPITHTPTVPTYGTNPGTISVVQPVQRVPRLPTYGPTPHY